MSKNDHGPIEERFREQMKALGRLIDDLFNGEGKEQKVGFALFVFPFGQGEDHRTNFISNANRESMIATLKEFIARAEGRWQEGA